MLFYFVKLVLELGALAALLWGGYRYWPHRGFESSPLSLAVCSPRINSDGSAGYSSARS
jgi:hypothetical protein